MVMAAKALIDRNPEPTDDDIKTALGGNLCRCTGYTRIIDAVRSWQEFEGDAAPEPDSGHDEQTHAVVGRSVPAATPRPRSPAARSSPRTSSCRTCSTGSS